MSMMTMMMGMMGTMMAKGGCKGAPPADLPPGTKTKKKVCQFFLEGRCAKGVNCTFAHGAWEIGMPQGTGELMCSFYQLGKCDKGALCTFSHGDEPTAYGSGASPGAPSAVQGAPQAQQADRSLPNIDDELTLLDREMQAIQNEIDRLASGESGPQPSSNAWGPASQQEGTSQSHQNSGGFVPKKVRLCTFYEQGRCTKGSACTFAHGEHELGIPQGTSAASPQTQWQDWSARSTPY